MEKNLINVSSSYIKANVEKGICPLNWLAEFYRDYPGKLVMVDKNLMSFLLNDSHCDKLEETKHDGYKQTFTIVWNATDKFPETRIVISSYGRDKIEKDEKYNVDSETNYYVIEELQAEDILVNDAKYAENMLTDNQMIFLVSKQLERDKQQISNGPTM